MLPLPTSTGYAKGHANVVCIIEMHKVAKKCSPTSYANNCVFFIEGERKMPNRTSFSPMHLYCRNIFQLIHIIFSYSECCNNVFSMHSHLQMQTEALCPPPSRSTHPGRLEGSSSCSLLQLLMHLLPLTTSNSSMVMTSGLRAYGRKGCWP
jgi:hypothetical protein